MRGTDLATSLRAAVGYACASQSRRGGWYLPPRPRLFDTSLAARLFKRAGLRAPLLRSLAFLRRHPPGREEFLPEEARNVGLCWEWPLHASARSLAFEGRAKRARTAELFLGHVARGGPVPPAAAALFACFAEGGELAWSDAPAGLSAALLSEGADDAERLWLAGVRLSRARARRPSARLEPFLRLLLRAQRADGGWRSDPALTSFLGLVLAPHAPSAAARASAWLAAFQPSHGGFGPPPVPREDTELLVRALRPFPEAAPVVARARRFLSSSSRWPSASFDRFNLWRPLREFAVSLSARRPWLVRESGPGWSGLERAQNGDGGWGFAPGLSSNAAATAEAVLALACAGLERRARRGARWLVRHQRLSGTWRFEPELLSPRPLRFARPAEGHARCVRALAAVERLPRASAG
jgi:hypothetical protein